MHQDRGLENENLRLREENARLKTENRRLHDELAENGRANETLLATNRRLQGQKIQPGSAPRGQLDSRGKLDYNELDSRALAAFRQFDQNGSGKLDYNELRNAFASLGIDCTTGEAVTVLQAYDTNGSGLLDLHEFASLAERLGLSSQPMPPSRLPTPQHGAPLDSRVAAAFRRFDRNGSGSLDYRELRGAMGELGIDCTTAEAVRVLQAYDADGNGLLDLYEFAGLAQRLGLSMQMGGGMLGGGGGMGMQGAMMPYAGPYACGGAGGYSCYGSAGRSPGRLILGRLGARSPGLRGGGSFEYESLSGQANDGDYFNSTAWKRLPKNVAHWTTADVVSWLVMVDEICFIEAFVRRQITGVTLLSLHLSSDDVNDAYELDNSPTDLRHVMVGVAAMDELRLRALIEHVAMLRKQNRRARQDQQDHAMTGYKGMPVYLGDHESGFEVEEAVRRRNRGWSVEHEYAAWRKLVLFRAHQALYEQHKEATRSWLHMHYRLLLLLSSLATVLGIVALAIFPNGDVGRVGSDGEDIFDSAKVGSFRWSWNLGTTVLTLALTAVSSALLRYTPQADRSLEECDAAIAQCDKLVAMYAKTLKAPIAKRQELLDFTAASDAIEAEKSSVLMLSAYNFRAAAARVKRHNAPVWRKYMRYVVVSEEVRCCGTDSCCSGGLLGSRFSSFEFPPSRIVGICLVHKVSEETLGRQLESTEHGEGARKAFDIFFSHELGQQPVSRLPGTHDGAAFVDPFCEPLRSLVPLEGGQRQAYALNTPLCNDVLERFLASKSRFGRGRGGCCGGDGGRGSITSASDRAPPTPRAKNNNNRYYGSPTRRSQTADFPADVPVPSATSYAV